MNRHILPISIIALSSLLATCEKKPEAADEPCVIDTASTAIAATLLTLSDAEKIMGEASKLTCNTFLTKKDTLEYKCDYTALAKDAVTGKTGKLYFMYEAYATEGAAQRAYAYIYEGNRKHAGVEVTPGLGDEAYYHSDGTNFYFYLVRKHEKMFRLKVNKVTSHSSVNEFKEAARRVAAKM